MSIVIGKTYITKAGFHFVVADIIENGQYAVDTEGYICPVERLRAI